MNKIKKTDTERDIFNKLCKGGITLENPLYKPTIELQEVIQFLKQKKHKVPKVLEEFAENLYKEHLKWKPF